MITFDELYLPAQLKIERAKHHISDLKRRIDTFLAERPFSLFMRVYPDIGEGSVRTKADKAIPTELSLIIGDAVHNLRSALDLTIYSLAAPRASSPDKIAFPFSKSGTGLDGSIGRSQAASAGDKVVEAIKMLKPFPGGNDALCAIHDLDILDKHRLLILARRIPVLSAEQVSILTGVPMVNGSIQFAGPEDSELIRVSVRVTGTRRERRVIVAKGPYDQEVDIHPTFHIAFGEDQPCSRKLVIETLSDGIDVVDTTVRTLISAYIDPANTFPA